MTTHVPLLDRLLHATLVTLGGGLLTVGFFLVLPLIEAVTQPGGADLLVRAADTAELPPPPDVPELEEPEEEPEPEEKPPELAEDEAPPMDLSSLELALNPGGGGEGFGAGELSLKLPGVASGAEAVVEEMFNADDLDQKPRCIHQPAPTLDAKLRKHTPGTVYVIFIVDPNGRVESPLVQKTTDPALDRAAVSAVKQWKFEPGKRKGKAVRFRMRVPITFPKVPES